MATNDEDGENLFGCIVSLKLVHWYGRIEPSYFREQSSLRDVLNTTLIVQPPSFSRAVYRLKRAVRKTLEDNCIFTSSGYFLVPALVEKMAVDIAVLEAEVDATVRLFELEYDESLVSVRRRIEEYFVRRWEKVRAQPLPPPSVICTFVNHALCFFPSRENASELMSLSQQMTSVYSEGVTLVGVNMEGAQSFTSTLADFVEELRVSYLSSVAMTCRRYLKNKHWFHVHYAKKFYEEICLLSQKNIFERSDVEFLIEGLKNQLLSYNTLQDKQVVYDTARDLEQACARKKNE